MCDKSLKRLKRLAQEDSGSLGICDSNFAGDTDVFASTRIARNGSDDVISTVWNTIKGKVTTGIGSGKLEIVEQAGIGFTHFVPAEITLSVPLIGIACDWIEVEFGLLSWDFMTIIEDGDDALDCSFTIGFESLVLIDREGDSFDDNLFRADTVVDSVDIDSAIVGLIGGRCAIAREERQFIMGASV